MQLGKHLDPFAGDSQSVTWTRPVNAGQLHDEVRAALGADVQLAVCGMGRQEDGSPAPVDESSPLTVFVKPSSVDATKLRTVLGAHRPDPAYGRSPVQAAFEQARAAIAAGHVLKLEQLTAVVAAQLGVVPGSGV